MLLCTCGGCGVGLSGRPGAKHPNPNGFSTISPIDRPSSAFVVTNRENGHRPGTDSAATSSSPTCVLFYFKPLKPSSYVSSFPHSTHTMSPHAVIKSESPPLQSVPISSVGQSYSQYSDTAPLFRFGTKEQSTLPPFSYISRHRSPHSAMSHLNAYSSTVSGSQSHFAVPPADDPGVLTATDEYDDGDEAGDFPSASGSSSKMDKAVRRRSSKGASRFSVSLPFDCTHHGPQNVACDQCRKSKCKCERTSLNEPCKACIMLGTRESFIHAL